METGVPTTPRSCGRVAFWAFSGAAAGLVSGSAFGSDARASSVRVPLPGTAWRGLVDGAGVAGAVKEAVSVVAVCDNAARDAATEWSGSVSGTLCALNTTSDLTHAEGRRL